MSCIRRSDHADRSVRYPSRVICPFPLVSSAEIAGVLRPGSSLSSSSALRTLRDNGLQPASCVVVPRSRSGARGRVVWYSALVLDVARLLRWGDRAQAGSVLRVANELMTGRAAAFVAESLGDAQAGPGADLGELDEATGGALSRLALLTESERRRAPLGERVRTQLATILGVTGAYATAVTDDGLKLGLPVATHGDLVFPAVGEVVAVDYEAGGDRSTLAWVRSAVVVSVGRDGRIPVEPSFLSAEERSRLLADDVLLAG